MHCVFHVFNFAHNIPQFLSDIGFFIEFSSVVNCRDDVILLIGEQIFEHLVHYV